MTIGILLILLGAAALSASVLTSVVTVLYLGILLIVVGGLEIISAFRAHRNRQFLVYFLAGVLSIVVGGLFLDRPLASLASLTLLVAGFLFASGLFRGVHAVVDRYPRWGWDLAYAFIAVILGAYMAAQWPVSALWVIGTIVGIEIIARGVTLVAASWVLRGIAHRGGLPGGFAPAR